MKSGTKEKSWKYSSILSPSVSLLVREKAYGPVIFSVMLNGVMIVFFSLTLMLDVSDGVSCHAHPNSQLLALVKVHHVLAELERGQHVQYLPDVRIRTFD